MNAVTTEAATTLRGADLALGFGARNVIDGVSVEIRPGRVTALVGPNGSGKSTLLKAACGILKPYKGTIDIRGNIAPLIELGAGFDYNMTARENIFLNGTVLGHSRKFMQEHFEEIVEFAELQQFLDVPIKNFSSGMFARLGFAVATIYTPDILIVDEILSVGDWQFQEKCHRRIQEMLEQGTTLLFVSHSMDQVRQVCNRAILLEHGHMIMDDDVEKVCSYFE